MTDTIVVVGASLAGVHAAATLRKEGFADRLVVVDGQPHTPYDRPPLSKQVLTGEWDTDRITLPALTTPLEIDWHLGRDAVGLDLDRRELALADGGYLTYDSLVLACGAAARRLPGQLELDGLHVLRTLDDAMTVRTELATTPSRVVVVGAGFIGSEVAATCRGLGLAVTLLEAADVPLERVLGRQMGQVCAEVHRDNGVDLRVGVGVEGLLDDGAGRVVGVRLTDGSTVEAGVVVVGVGVTPNTGWLAGSGLTIDDGVVVDETLCAAPGVVAAGDIARWPSRRFGESLRVEHWENAIQMGEAAARRLLSERTDMQPKVYDPVPWFWSDQYDRKIQLAGRSGIDDEVEVVHGSTEERRFVALYGRDGRLVGVLGMNHPRQVMLLRQLLVDGATWDEARTFGRDLV